MAQSSQRERFSFGSYKSRCPLPRQFREVLAGRHTRVAELQQPVFAWK
jgi:hypothetical protein